MRPKPNYGILIRWTLDTFSVILLRVAVRPADNDGPRCGLAPRTCWVVPEQLALDRRERRELEAVVLAEDERRRVDAEVRDAVVAVGEAQRLAGRDQPQRGAVRGGWSDSCRRGRQRR